MRLWTLHPRYLDPGGLVALWREGLLARAVLRGQTLGYRHHPQLARFQALEESRSAINAYLAGVFVEANVRGYSFDRSKIGPVRRGVVLVATEGQLAYEWSHLMDKLRRRSPQLHRKWQTEHRPEPHPLFRMVAGDVEPWERQSPAGPLRTMIDRRQ